MQDSLQDMEVFGQEEWAALPSEKIKVPHPQLLQKKPQAIIDVKRGNI